MFGFTLRETQVVSGVTVVAAMAAAITLYWMSRKRPSPDELERDRRDALVQRGRIIDATVLDISELSPEESERPLGMQLLPGAEAGTDGFYYACLEKTTTGT